MTTLHAFEFLESPTRKIPRICVVFGNERYLKQLVSERIQQMVLGDDDEAPFATFAGKTGVKLLEWRDVIDELTTISLFSSTRLVKVDDADPFVSEYRSQLEDLAAAPQGKGVLLLSVDQWAANTRLFKVLSKSGLQVDCRPPGKAAGDKAISAWLVKSAKNDYGYKLPVAAAAELVSVVGPQFGLLIQSVAKLALYVTKETPASVELVRHVIGGWRAMSTWDTIEMAAAGDADGALLQLDKLLKNGEAPQALLAQITWSLRRFNAATRLIEKAEREGRKVRLTVALADAGFRTYGGELSRAESQLRQIGRRRASRLYQTLLQADLALKGTHSDGARARLVLESLVVGLSKVFRPDPPARAVG